MGTNTQRQNINGHITLLLTIIVAFITIPALVSCAMHYSNIRIQQEQYQDILYSDEP